MKFASVIARARKISRPFRVTKGDGFRLKDFDPGDTGSLGIQDKEAAEAARNEGVDALASLQEMLYAEDRWAALFLVQAMDAAGKDSVIKHVMSGVNPQGCQVASFKSPSTEELDHDYLWRCQRELPERGRIGIFNRSYYEEVLVVRVHPEYLAAQRLPAGTVTDDLWEERFRQIRRFERHLQENGTRVTKFFLNVSREEQKRRFLERIEKPEKNWKFNVGDLKERSLWKEYMKAYEEMIRNTATDDAPWYVVPADHKWFTRLVVAQVIVSELESLRLRYPKVDAERKKEIEGARKALEKEKG